MIFFIEKYLESPQYNLRVVINQMHLLERQRSERHFMKSAELTRERIRLAKILIDRLETIESKTGVFLIKPIPTIRSLERFVSNINNMKCFWEKEDDQSSHCNIFSLYIIIFVYRLFSYKWCCYWKTVTKTTFQENACFNTGTKPGTLQGYISWTTW